MKISDRRRVTAKFEYLAVGDYFYDVSGSADNLMRRLPVLKRDDGKMVNAVLLQSGQTTCVTKEQVVQPVEVEIVIVQDKSVGDRS